MVTVLTYNFISLANCNETIRFEIHISAQIRDYPRHEYEIVSQHGYEIVSQVSPEMQGEMLPYKYKLLM